MIEMKHERPELCLAYENMQEYLRFTASPHPLALTHTDFIYAQRKLDKMLSPRWVARTLDRLGYENDFPPPKMESRKLVEGNHAQTGPDRKPGCREDSQGSWRKWRSSFEILERTS